MTYVFVLIKYFINLANNVRIKASISAKHQNSLFDEHNKEFAEQQAKVCIVSTPWIPNLARTEATAALVTINSEHVSISTLD